MEHEKNDMLLFLGIAIQRRADATIQRSVNRKNNCNGLYPNFFDFFPTTYKKALAKILFFRVERICDPDKTEEELANVEKSLRDNYYSQKSIVKCIKSKENKTGVTPVNKKPSIYKS